MEEVTFDIESQAAAAITNIGGNQTVYAGEKRSPVPRLVALIGLLLSLTGLGLLVLTGIRTADALLASNFWPSDPAYYTDADVERDIGFGVTVGRGGDGGVDLADVL